MSPEEKRMQYASVITINNVAVIKEILMTLMLETKTRVLEDEFNTIVYNAKVQGQIELLDNFTKYSKEFINPMN